MRNRRESMTSIYSTRVQMSEMALVNTIPEEIQLHEEEVQAVSEDEEKTTGFKSLLMISYDGVFKLTVFVFGILASIMAIYSCTITEWKMFFSVKYVIKLIADVLFLIDGSLGLIINNNSNIKVDPEITLLPNWLLICELISVFPDWLILENFGDASKIGLLMFCRLDFLKVFRPLYVISKTRRTVGLDVKYVILGRHFFFQQLLMAYAFTLAIVSFCNGWMCTEKNTYDRFDFSIDASTFRGIDADEKDAPYVEFILLVIIPLSSVIMLTTVSDLAFILSNKFLHYCMFVLRKECVSQICKQYGIEAAYQREFLRYFDVHWKYCKGYDNRKPFLQLLPRSIQQEMAVDICWPALQHSKLFQNMDLPFLRKISSVMREQYMAAGEYLYRKDMVKHRMVYIVSGIVEVLSESDGETPILAFSTGTVLGEMSLFITHKAVTSVRCKNFCEFHVLHKKDFFAVASNFPRELSKMKKNVAIRCDRAVTYRSLFDYFNQEHKSHANISQLTITWLKNTLHKLMMKDGETSTEHECQNIYLREDFSQDKFDKMYFTATYLDLLAITGRLELIDDKVFLRQTFPWVFQPDSVLLKWWKILVCTEVLATGIIIPFVAFVEDHEPDWLTIFNFFSFLIYFLDILIVVSTAVRHKGILLVDVKSIFSYRVTQPEFWLDVIAAFPFEMYSALTITKKTSQRNALLHLPRILKMWKIKTQFLDFGQHDTWLTVVVKMNIKHLCSFTYLTYLTGCILYSDNCFEGKCKVEVEGDTTINKFVWFYLVAMSLTGFNGVHNPYYQLAKKNILLCGLFTMIGMTIFMLILSENIAHYSLMHRPRILVEESAQDLLTVVRVLKVDPYFSQRILDYLNAQWKYHKGKEFLLGTEVMASMPATLYRRFREEMLLEIVSNIPVFMGLRCDLLSELTRLAVFTFVPPGEVIAYSGQVNDSFSCIIRGHCEMFIGEIVDKQLGPGDCISVLEVFLRMPNINTVTTTTHVELISFDYKGINSVMTKYPVELELLKQILNTRFIRKDLLKLTQRIPAISSAALRSKSVEADYSFVKFGYNLQVDSYEEYAYFVPFDKLGTIGWIRIFLLRITIMPFGRFLIGWEIVRSICAFLSSIIFVIPATYSSNAYIWSTIRTILDLTSVLDIYLRLHVCYYNSKGLLVTHPLYTAKNYLSHAFLLDVLCIFPTEILIKSDPDKINPMMIYLKLFHIIQMYRYWGLIDVFTDYIPLKPWLYACKYIPFYIIFCNAATSLLTHMDCVFHSSIENTPNFHAGVECEPNSLFVISQYEKPLSPSYVHFIGFYFTTSVFTLSGMHGFTIKSKSDSTFTAIVGFLGMCALFWITSKLIAAHTIIRTRLLYYQSSLKNVKDFLKARKVKPVYQAALVDHYELKWQRKRGKDLSQTLTIVSHSLRQDILWDVYGTVLEQYSVFQEGCVGFFRQLLLETTHETVLGGTPISRVNFVNSEMYIVFKGFVDVIAPDGTLLTTLGIGSMCGNLDNYNRCRQTVSLVSKGHTEILVIKAIAFHALLQKFPMLNRRFQSLTALHIDYLQGRYTDIMGWSMSQLPRTPKGNRFVWLFKEIKNHVFNPNYIGMRIWKVYILLFVHYIPFYMIMYSIAMFCFGLPFVLISYWNDLMFLIDLYVRLHTAYEDESGTLIVDFSRIKERFKKDRLSFIVTIIVILPFDMWIWFVPSTIINRATYFSLLRINKLARIYFYYISYKNNKERLNVNIVLVRMIYFTGFIFAIFHTLCCIFLILSCAFPSDTSNRFPPITCEDLTKSDTAHFSKFLDFYMENVFLVLTATSHFPQSNVYPLSGLLLVSYSIFMQLCSSFLVAYLFVYIFNTVNMAAYKQLGYANMIERMKFYMSKQDVSLALVDRIWSYVRRLWDKYKGETFPQLLKEAPPMLKSDILNSVFGRVIKSCPVFEHCHRDFLSQVVMHLEVVSYYPGDYIVFKGDIDDSMYFIREGEVFVLSVDTIYKREVAGTLTKGQVFGVVQGLFPLTEHVNSFKAKKISEILVLNLRKWDFLLNFFPASKDTIYEALSDYVGY